MVAPEDRNVADLAQRDHSALSAIWLEIMEQAPPKRLSSPLMRRLLAYQMQVRTDRGLTKRDADKLKAMGKPDRRPKAPSFRPGSRLIREWNGRRYEVEVLEKGFSWNGGAYRSLSAIAEAITGTRWSGPRFFGIEKATR